MCVSFVVFRRCGQNSAHCFCSSASASVVYLKHNMTKDCRVADRQEIDLATAAFVIAMISSCSMRCARSVIYILCFHLDDRFGDEHYLWILALSETDICCVTVHRAAGGGRKNDVHKGERTWALLTRGPAGSK